MLARSGNCQRFVVGESILAGCRLVHGFVQAPFNIFFPMIPLFVNIRGISLDSTLQLTVNIRLPKSENDDWMTCHVQPASPAAVMMTRRRHVHEEHYVHFVNTGMVCVILIAWASQLNSAKTV